MPTLKQLAQDLDAARTTSRALVEQCLWNIRVSSGEGARAFLKVREQEALAAADRIDAERKRGRAASQFAGIPISVKDLFDVRGDVTTAASRVLREDAPATRDAASVARLIAAGFIVIGRTNMTEFAFSGLGLNPHFGTPANPFDRHTRRIPGGSSSGAAVSVTDEMAFAALGTDTGGSCRIPAAFCGIVGFKPTARRVPQRGVFPLAPSLDSIGPLARSVDCCAAVDRILSSTANTLPSPSLRTVRVGVPTTIALDDLDEPVASAFQRVLSTLSARGAVIEEFAMPELAEIVRLNDKGGIAPPEALARHRDWISENSQAYDPRVLARILRGREQDAAEYIRLREARVQLIRRCQPIFAHFDALLMPTVPFVAPPIDSLADDAHYLRANALALRNPGFANFLDGFAISLPCHREGDAPVGCMLMAGTRADLWLLAIAAAVESAVESSHAK